MDSQTNLSSVDSYAAALSTGLIPPKSDASSSLLRILTSRDAIWQELKEGVSLPQNEISRIVELDASLRAAAPLLVRSVARDLFSKWRASRLADPAMWWWFLDLEPSTQPRYEFPLTVLAWVAVALSLSVIVEDLRRLLAPGSDGLSTAVQGLLAFLIGGTAVQYSKELLNVRTERGEPSRRSRQWRIYCAVGLALAAGVLEWQRPGIAKYFTKIGTEYNELDRSKALAAYQRAAALNPDSADAHADLAVYYEGMFDFEKAEPEYLASLRADSSIPPVYDALARLAMLRRKDFQTAIRLCNFGLEKAERAKPGGPITADVITHWKYRLYITRAWAFLQSSANVDARADLVSAQTIEPIDAAHHNASPYCLLAQVDEKQLKWDDEKNDKESCINLNPSDEHPAEIQPGWLSLAKEPVPKQPVPKEIAGQRSKRK